MKRALHVLAVLSALLVATARGEVTYSVRDLGTLGGANSRAHAINEDGVVVGEAETAAGALRAFRWTPDDGMQDLGTLGGEISRAYAVNDRGDVAGEAEDAEGRMLPFRWKAGPGLSALPLPEGFREGFVYAANNFGVFAGGGERDGVSRALVWTVDGVSVPEPLRGLGASLIHAVNDVGELAGQVEDAPEQDYVSRAFRLGDAGLQITRLSAGADLSSAAMALASDGLAAGYAEWREATHAVHFGADGAPRDLDTLENVYSIAHDLNDAGVAVGLFVSSHEDEDRAFIARDGAMADLNELVETDEPWLLIEARGINNRGQIVGYGLLRERERAFLLTPNPPAKTPRPRIRMTAPAPRHSVVEGTPVALEAEAQAEAGVRRVTFFSSGVILGTATGAPYRWTWEQPPAGMHHLVAAAVDMRGRVSRSARVPMQVRLAADEGLAAALIEPDDGTALSAGHPLSIVAEAMAPELRDPVVRVQLDGVDMASTNAPVLQWTWTPAQTGLYTWVAVATDASGAVATSRPARVNVTVDGDL